MSQADPNEILVNVSRLLDLINSNWTAQATRVVAELGQDRQERPGDR